MWGLSRARWEGRALAEDGAARRRREQVVRGGHQEMAHASGRDGGETRETEESKDVVEEVRLQGSGSRRTDRVHVDAEEEVSLDGGFEARHLRRLSGAGPQSGHDRRRLADDAERARVPDVFRHGSVRPHWDA